MCWGTKAKTQFEVKAPKPFRICHEIDNIFCTSNLNAYYALQLHLIRLEVRDYYNCWMTNSNQRYVFIALIQMVDIRSLDKRINGV